MNDKLDHPYLPEPLYIIGAGDLGTTAQKVDGSLATILKISASWGAVVLIDEADVFLEERALHHIERNAMVAVFLRHLESVLISVTHPFTDTLLAGISVGFYSSPPTECESSTKPSNLEYMFPSVITT